MKKTVYLTCAFILVLLATGFASADITTLTIREKAGVTTPNYPLTFAHVFKQGDVPEGQGVAVSVNGQQLTTQFDIKRRYSDNSVRHGVISVVLPGVQAGEDLLLTLETIAQESSTDGAMTKAEILDTGVESRMDLTALSGAELTGSPYSGNLTADLNQAIEGAAAMNYWLQGSVCTEILAEQVLNPSLTARWEVRFYPGWDGVRISNAMENVQADAVGNVNYALDIQMGSDDHPLTTVYTKSEFQHNYSARWRKVLWIGQAPPEVEIRYDIDYLIATGMILNYDTSVPVSEQAISESYANWQSSAHDIMDTSYVRVDFGGTGNRPARGPLPVWAVRYLLSMDNRMKEITLNLTEIFSGAPSHYREYDGARSFVGHILSIDDRPGLYLSRNYRSDSADAIPESVGDTDTVWSIDRAHQGAYAYIPYMVTGEKYYLDELYFWAGYDLACGNQSYRQYEQGLISDQVRGEAWAIRSIGQAAALAPDADMEKAYLEEKVASNITAWTAEQNRYPLNHWGQISTLPEEGGKPWSGATENVSATASAWQEDYVLLSLTHLKELGYNTQPIIDWFSEFHINRFTHPDFNWYNGADYRLPVEENNSRYFETWLEVRNAFMDQPTSFPEPAACNYRRIALAALSCITDITIEQQLANGSTVTATGQQAYNWLRAELANDWVYEEDPRWAIVPRLVGPDGADGGTEPGGTGDNDGSGGSGGSSGCFIQSLRGL